MCLLTKTMKTKTSAKLQSGIVGSIKKKKTMFFKDSSRLKFEDN